MSSTMLLRGAAVRPCVTARLRTGNSNRPVARPLSLHSQFTPACNSLSSLTSSFAGCSLNTAQRLPARSRHTLLVQAKNHGSQACTLQGSRKRRTRTSGFRARRLTVGGRRVLKNRRKKGRHVLCPANNANRKAAT